MSPRIEHLVTAGNPERGGPPVHENNVWLIGDDREVIVVDPAHDADAVQAAVAGRTVVAVLLTHGHWDHVRAAAKFAGNNAWLHPADEFLWREEHATAQFRPLTGNIEFEVAGITLEGRHTPGHTPGSMSFVAAELGAVFSGDTLFEGGPGATRWPYSSFSTITASIESRLLTLPDETVVHTGHGRDTTIGTERVRMPEYLARGW